MRHLRSSSALALVFIAASSIPVLAASFTVATGDTDTTTKSLTDTQSGVVESGGTLNTSSSTLTLGAATGSGIMLTNDGSIISGNRAIDAGSGATGQITVTNRSSITSTDDTFRINGTFASGSLLLDNSGTMSSSSGQVLDFDKTAAATAVLDITNSGTMRSSGADAVRLGSGTITLTNSGTIETTSSGKRAIKFDTAGNLESLVSFTLSNSATGHIIGTDDGIKIAGSGSSTSSAIISIDNAGEITSNAGGQAIDLGDLVSENLQITITNRATGEITASDNDAIKAGMNTTVENYGQIVANYTDTMPDDQNFDGVKFDGASGTVNNYADALISGSYHGVKASGSTDDIAVNNWGVITGRNGSGVNSNGTATVVNYGTIRGNFDPDASFGDGDGVDIDLIGTITNYGVIEALGSKGVKPGETNPSTSEGIAIGGGTITNGSAGVRTARISGADNGILADDSNGGSILGALSVTNYGTIEGLDGYGIRIVNDAGYSNTIVNYGTISGTTYAVSMGNGDDLFVYQSGSSVTGAVMADGGTDTLRLGDSSGSFDLGLLGDTKTYQYFEALQLASGSTWALTGSSDFSGTTTVTSAVLDLQDASLAASAVSVSGSGAMLKGTGTIGSTTIGSSATLSPGHSIGTLAIAGDLTLQSGSVYAVETDASGHADAVTVTGTADIESGASVSVRAANGTDDGSTYRANTTYSILTANGGVSGTFSSLDENFAYLSGALSYDTSSVYLTLSRIQQLAFADLATTSNQKAVAAAVDARGSGAVYDAVLVLPTGAPDNAFDQLSGEVHTALDGAMLSRAGMMRGTIENRIQSAFGGVGARSTAGVLTAYGEDGLDLFSTSAVELPTLFWTSGFGRWSHLDGGSAAADSDVRGGGVLFGADRLLEAGWRLGMAAGYGADRIDTSGVDARADSDNYHIAAYGGRQVGPLGLRFGAAYTRSDVSSRRSVDFSGFTDHLTANYDANTYQFFGEAAWRIDQDLVHIEPYANLAYVSVDRDGFTENGGAAALSVGHSREEQVQSTLGVRLDRDVAVSGYLGKVYAGAGWRHVFGDVSSTATQAFGDGTSFEVSSAATSRDAVLLNAGISFELAPAATFSVGYSGSFGSGDRDHEVSGTLALNF